MLYPLCLWNNLYFQCLPPGFADRLHHVSSLHNMCGGLVISRQIQKDSEKHNTKRCVPAPAVCLVHTCQQTPLWAGNLLRTAQSKGHQIVFVRCLFTCLYQLYNSVYLSIGTRMCFCSIQCIKWWNINDEITKSLLHKLWMQWPFFNTRWLCFQTPCWLIHTETRRNSCEQRSFASIYNVHTRWTEGCDGGRGRSLNLCRYRNQGSVKRGVCHQM